jgi:hypothetical protein
LLVVSSSRELRIRGDGLGLGLRHRKQALGDHLAGLLVDDVTGRDAAGDARLGADRGLLEDLGPVEEAEDVGVRRVVGGQGADEGGAGELAALVDADEERVLLADVQFDPGAALGDDPAGVQLPLAGVDLHGEVDTGRTVELGDDHALGAVDDELPAADHDRDLAEVDLLLDGLRTLELHADAEGHPEGEAEPPALVGRVAGLPEVVVEVLQRAGTVEGLDRKHLAEDGLEAEVLPAP